MSSFNKYHTYLVAVNLGTFVLFGYDKSQAVCGAWRIPEWQLLTAALAGGWVGAKVGQVVFKHKTRKEPFGTLLNCVPIVWVVALESVRGGLTRDILTQQVSWVDVRAKLLQKRAWHVLRNAAANTRDTFRQQAKAVRDGLSNAWRTGRTSTKEMYTAVKERVYETFTSSKHDTKQKWQRMRESVGQKAESLQTNVANTTQRVKDAAWRKKDNAGGISETKVASSLVHEQKVDDKTR